MNPVVLSETNGYDEYDGSDNVPLASLKQNDLGLRKPSAGTNKKCLLIELYIILLSSFLDGDSVSVFDYSDAFPTYSLPCEFRNCKDKVFSMFHRCFALLCWNHFQQIISCEIHGKLSKPEDFKTEGVEKEGTHEKITRVNKKKKRQTF